MTLALKVLNNYKYLYLNNFLMHTVQFYSAYNENIERLSTIRRLSSPGLCIRPHCKCCINFISY